MSAGGAGESPMDLYRDTTQALQRAQSSLERAINAHARGEHRRAVNALGACLVDVQNAKSLAYDVWQESKR